MQATVSAAAFVVHRTTYHPVFKEVVRSRIASINYLTLNTCLNTMSMKFEIVYPTWRFEKARKKFVLESQVRLLPRPFTLPIRVPGDFFFSITPNRTIVSSIMKSNNKFSHTLREGSPKTKRLKYTLNV